MNNTELASHYTHTDRQNNNPHFDLDILNDEGLGEFNNRLHEFLDFYQLFDTFINELRALVACDSIEYEDKVTDTTLLNGYTGTHHCEYALKYEGMSLGTIRITRDTKLSENELDIIEAMLAGLTLPLRNALRYQQAIRFAQRDELTGLRNGSYYHDTVNLEIERARRYKKPFSLLMFDLDDFEKINDEYGREAGDAVLLDVA
ncbi:MAG TPA: diguanylate cyclase, partial [Gammaproteobacteria bacterium]|nr:diguanylate cyclase [Gammaproteobacteria bacterium]